RDRHRHAAARCEKRRNRQYRRVSRNPCSWNAARVLAHYSFSDWTYYACIADHQRNLSARTIHGGDDAANCWGIAVLRRRTRLIRRFESPYAGVLRGRQTQYANGRELPCNWYESFSQLAFHVSAWLGAPRSCVFHKFSRNDQFSFALRIDVAAHTQIGNTPAVRRARQNLRGRRAACAGLLGGKSLVARRMGAFALFRKVIRATRRDRR